MNLTDIAPRLLLAGIALSACVPAAAVEHVLKFQTFVGEQSLVWQQMHRPWMEKVEKASGGRIRFDRRPLMGDGHKPAELFDQVRQGQVDVGWTQPTLSGNRFGRLEAFELPSMLTDSESVSRAYWEYVQTYAADAFDDVHLIALHVGGPAAIHTRKRAVRSLAELKNLRVSSSTRQSTALLEALGAKPVAQSPDELGPALARHTVDGVVAPWASVPDAKLDTLTSFHTEIDPDIGALSANAYVLAMNKQTYEKMPADLRKIIDSHAGIETSAWLGRTHQRSSQAGRAESTGTVITLNGKSAELFRKAAASVEARWVKQVNAQGFDGQQLLDGARTLIKKHTK